MQRISLSTFRGVRIVKHDVETYSCGYTSKGSGERPLAVLYAEKDKGAAGETIFIPVSQLSDYIVKVFDDKKPDTEQVADFTKARFVSEMERYLSEGWLLGRKCIDLCINSLTNGKAVSSLPSISRFDEIYACPALNTERGIIWRNGKDTAYLEGDKIPYDDCVAMLTE